MSVKLIFGHIKENSIDPKTYIQNKLYAFLNNEVSSINMQDNPRSENIFYNLYYMNSSSETTLPLATECDYPEMDRDLKQKVRIGKKCIINEMNKYYKPELDECIVSDTVSYLKKDYGELKKGTVVLQRETNFAKLFYIKNSIFVYNDTWETIDYSAAPVLQPLTLGPETVIFDLLITFAKALASKVGSEAGAKIIETLFGSNTIDMNALVSSIEDIVHCENVKQTIVLNSGPINSVINEVSIYYPNRKKVDTKDELYKWLQSKSATLNNSLATLQEDYCKEAAIYAFISGANTLFSVYQEMILQDSKVTDYKKSPDIETLKSYINKYVYYLQDLKNTILTKRLNDISKVIKKETSSYVPPGEVIVSYHYEYTDHFTHQTFNNFYDDDKKKIDGYKEANADRDARIHNLTSEMDWVDTVISEWKLLLESPIK